MRFFNIYDVVINKAKEMGQTEKEMYAQLKTLKVNKVDLLEVKVNGSIPTDECILNGILTYLEMSKIELELSLGRIPTGYEDVFFNQKKEIAKILEESSSLDDTEATPTEPLKPYYSTDYGTLYNGDCLELLKQLPAESVDCVFADPPFNLDKEYDEGVSDNKTDSFYIDWYFKWVDECVRVLKPNGSLFIYNIPKWNTYLSGHLNEKLTFWNWISIDMKFSLPIQNRLYPAHYSLLHYVKGKKPKTFNSQRTPLLTCRHCGGEQKDYGGYKNKMNPKGVNLSDVWTDIYPVRHSSSKNRKFNELSVKLLERVISMSTNENDIVLDPFGGSGTTFAVSELLGRKWIGFELGNCEIIKDRLDNKERDIALLEKVYEEKNKLFPEKVKKLRRKNDFWLPEDFQDTTEKSSEKSVIQTELQLETK